MDRFNMRVKRRSKVGCSFLPLTASLVGVLGCIVRYCWVCTLCESVTIPTVDRLHTATHYICYTYNNAIRASLRSHPGVFSTSIDNLAVFITSEQDVYRIFNVNASTHGIVDLCQMFDANSESYCCAYSPGLVASENYTTRMYNQLHSWEYKYDLKGHADKTHTAFDISDMFYVKPKMITQCVRFKHVTKNNSELTLEGTHKCRGDIPLDVYPEIHLTVAITHGGSPSNVRDLHWYL